MFSRDFCEAAERENITNPTLQQHVLIGSLCVEGRMRYFLRLDVRSEIM